MTKRPIHENKQNDSCKNCYEKRGTETGSVIGIYKFLKKRMP